tara:strand:- start:8806 stop:10209 length:1404 start_codon:yes stop_codon:yes gene_type:complete
MNIGLVVFSLYIALMFFHAWTGNKRIKNPVDFNVAGRGLPGLVIGLSFYASFMSTNSFLGLAGRSHSWGFSIWGSGILFIVFAWLSWRFIAPRLRERTEELGALTLSDYLGYAFNSKPYEKAVSVVILLASIPFMQAVFKGVSLVIQQLTGLSPGLSLLTAWFVVVVYTVAGGFHAVAKTDVVQGVIMVIASVCLPFSMIKAGGGFQNLLEVSSIDAGVNTVNVWTMAPLGAVLGIGLAGGFKMMSEPRQVSRFFAIEKTEIKKGQSIALWTLSISYLLILPVGFLSRGFLQGYTGDLDKIVPTLLSMPEVVHPLLGAVFLAAFLAAAMSSLDSILLAVSGSIQRSLVGKTGTTSQQELHLTRCIVIFLSIVPALLVLYNPGEIIALTTLSGAVFGAAFLPSLIHSLYRKTKPVNAAWASLFSGVFSVLLWKFFVTVEWAQLKIIHEVVAGTLISFIVFYLFKGKDE